MLYRYQKEKEIKFKIISNSGYFTENGQGRLEDRGFVLKYESPVKTGISENDSVNAEFFIPENIYSSEIKGKNKFYACREGTGNQKVIILLHGFNSKQDQLGNFYYFIKKALRNDCAVLFLNLPYHLNRTPAGEQSGQRLINSRDSELLEFFDQSVKDIQKAMAILSNIFEPANCLKFYICGLSLGGMVAAITAAWEPSLEKSVLLECGGNWDDIYWKSLIRIILRGTFIDKTKIRRKEAAEFYAAHPAFIKEFKKVNPPLIDAGLESYPSLSAYRQKTMFLSDPLTFAHRVKTEKVLMINAKFDILFCRASTEKLWAGLGKPEIKWLNDFHGTRVLANNSVIKKIFDFMDK